MQLPGVHIDHCIYIFIHAWGEPGNEANFSAQAQFSNGQRQRGETLERSRTFTVRGLQVVKAPLATLQNTDGG